MLGRVPITVSAPLLVGIPVLAVGVVLSGMWSSQSRKGIVELADQNIEQIHDLASLKVADVLSIPVRVCRVNAHLVRSGQLDPANLDSWRPTFVEEARAFEMLSAISFGAADGRTAWVSRYADGSFYWALRSDPGAGTMLEWRIEDDDHAINGAPSNEFDFDLFARPWFRTPREQGAATWSDPYVWVGGGADAEITLGLSYGIPLFDDDGAFIGIIDADFSLNDLSSYLRTLEIGRNGMAVLASLDALMLAASNDTPIATRDGERVNAYESPDPLVVAAANYIGTAESVRGKHAEIEVDGETYYLRASPVGREVGLNWTLATIVPEQDFIADVERDFRRSTLTSLLAVALTVLLGIGAARWLVAPILTLVTAVRRIGQGDLETKVTLDHAPEYRKLGEEINAMTVGLQDRMRMRESLSLAMEVQKNLLPSGEPDIAGLDLSGHSTYCDETGGDYYDFLDVTGTDDQTVVIALGDVMGHGVAAAMLMATARGILRSRCAVAGSLADFLEHLNSMLVPDTRGQRFMTMQLVTLNAQREELRWASAGHGPPIIYDAYADRFLELEGGGLPLGLVATEDYEEYTETGIRTGFIIVAATDGLWEAKAPDGTLYGMERVQTLLRENAHRSAAEISEVFRQALAEYRGPEPPDDDLTFVIAKVE